MTDGIKARVDFDDIYQSGHAMEKHMILQHPVTDRWYILRCQHMHFGLKPVVGAMRHLVGGEHGPSATRADAIRILGIGVENCNSDKSKRNNNIFREALENGYKPFKAKGSTSRRLTKLPYTVVESESPIAKIHTGDIYQAYLSTSAGWHAIVVQTVNRLDSVGLSASLSDTRLTEHIPRCYYFNRHTKEILGWQQGYEDGGPDMKRRILPVMYPGEQCIPVDGEFGLPRDARFLWISADSVRFPDLESADSDSVSGCKSARELRSRIARCREDRLGQDHGFPAAIAATDGKAAQEDTNIGERNVKGMRVS
ncbi:hypothetical protein BDY21DRAFT_39863 [Lineolata rhizophorae]|uniref:Uncharacterized protein n=1 Tax=Lineolata rhizophorae TaxID=578093 RepID=A0A6A6NYT2_9PEZI|nr:hypothetical protein BDY21DRAFT_39863 [Lineolata rhizophorae]